MQTYTLTVTTDIDVVDMAAIMDRMTDLVEEAVWNSVDTDSNNFVISNQGVEVYRFNAGQEH